MRRCQDRKPQPDRKRHKPQHNQNQETSATPARIGSQPANRKGKQQGYITCRNTTDRPIEELECLIGVRISEDIVRHFAARVDLRVVEKVHVNGVKDEWKEYASNDERGER